MKRTLAIILVLIMALSLCACTFSGRHSDDYRGEGASAYSSAYVPNMSVPSDAAMGYGGYAAAETSYSYYSEEAAKYDSASSTGASESEDTSGTESTEQDINPEKIIYSADAKIETTEFEKTIEALGAMIENFGGWTESSSVNGNSYGGSSGGRSANYTIRVSNEKFDELMSSLSELGNVPYSHVYTENVTAQYYDSLARLESYQAQEKRLIELLNMAETVSDVIEIEDELTEVRYRIESVQTSLRGWDRRVAWSTVTLKITEVSEYTAPEKTSYGKKLVRAVKYGIEDLGDVFLGFIEVLPVLLLFAAIVTIVVLVIRGGIRKGKARRAARAAAKAEKAGDK